MGQRIAGLYIRRGEIPVLLLLHYPSYPLYQREISWPGQNGHQWQCPHKMLSLYA